jgi:hypothetical protein
VHNAHQIVRHLKALDRRRQHELARRDHGIAAGDAHVIRSPALHAAVIGWSGFRETTALITKLLMRNHGMLGDAAAPVTDLRSSSPSAFGVPCNSVAARLLDDVLAKIEPFYNRLY